MDFFNRYNIKKGIRKAIREEQRSSILENYEYTTNNVIKTLSFESSNQNDWKIVAKAEAQPQFVGKTMYLVNFYNCSVCVYDPQFKILNEKHSKSGKISEKNTRFAKHVFDILLRNYRNGK